MNPSLAISIFVMAVATFLCRAAVLFLPRRFVEHPTVVQLGSILPLQILFLLVIYSVKDASWTAPRYGIPELLGLTSVFVFHLIVGRPVVSVIFGTAFFMTLQHLI